MHDRLEDLFILDAEQAARELLIYGEGRSELPIDRLSGTTEYLAPLLQSCGLLRHADVCMLFADLFEVADEGQIKRLVREFSELLIHSLDALKAGTTISELGENAALEQLFGRLQQFSPGSSQLERAPYPSRFRQVDSHPADPDRELIANAFRAIEAVDSLAVMIAREAHEQVAGDVHGEDALELKSHESPAAESHASLDQPPALSPGAELVNLTTGLFVGATASQTMSATAIPLTEASGSNLKGDKLLRVVSSVEIDAAFRKALRLAHEGPWTQGMTTLLESIDVLDHVDLREALPTELQLVGNHEILVQPTLANMLSEELRQARVAGLGDAMLVSQTLILAIQLDRFLPADRLAKQLAIQGGRIEVDTALKRWRIVVPASSRLLRVTQLQVDGSWIAVPWAQFLGIEGKTSRQEAQLCLGNEADKLRIDALGLVSTGVRFELARVLRRRERYRGVVMLATSDCLPIYA